MKLGLPPPTATVSAGRHVPADQASYACLIPGDTLDGRFLIDHTLSIGGMATIFKAVDLQNRNQTVAVKVPHAAFTSGFGSSSRFQREAEMGSRLNHPSILKFVPVGPTQRASYLVTELVNGHTLAHRLSTGGMLAEKEALDIARRICEALQYLHEHQVVHYDLKPGNVMLCADGSIRLLDFGLAQPARTRRFGLFASSPAMGTPDYMAPEQILRKQGRPCADIYSVGVILFEMLTGSVPFPGDDPFVIGSVRLTGDPPPPRKLNPSLSPQAEEIVLRALQRDPARRYSTAAAMKADLEAPDQVRVTGLCDRLKPSMPWKRARRILGWVLVWCVAPVASQLLLYVWLWHHFAKPHR
jgi:serine/threonine protein kinase